MLREHQRVLVQTLFRQDKPFRVYSKDNELIYYPGVPDWYDVGRFLNKECVILRVSDEIEVRLLEDIYAPKESKPLDSFEGGFLVGVFFTLLVMIGSLVLYFDFR